MRELKQNQSTHKPHPHHGGAKLLPVQLVCSVTNTEPCTRLSCAPWYYGHQDVQAFKEVLWNEHRS